MDKGTPREQVGRVYVGLCELLYAPWRGQHITPGQEEAIRGAIIACPEMRGHLESETDGEPQAAGGGAGDVADTGRPQAEREKPDAPAKEEGEGLSAAPAPEPAHEKLDA